MLQMEKVIPAGTNKLGRASESSWVVFSFIGSVTANALIIIVAITAILFPVISKRFNLFLSIISQPMFYKTIKEI